MSDSYALVPTADLEALRAEIAALRADLQRATVSPVPEWLSIADAASRLGVSTDTIRRRIDRGEIEARGSGKLRQVRVLP